MSGSEEEVDEWKCEASAPSLQLSGEVGRRQACFRVAHLSSEWVLNWSRQLSYMSSNLLPNVIRLVAFGCISTEYATCGPFLECYHSHSRLDCLHHVIHKPGRVSSASWEKVANRMISTSIEGQLWSGERL